MNESSPLLGDKERDKRLRQRARETIQYELQGAINDGLTPNDDWTELVHGRDVLSLLRERDSLLVQVAELSLRLSKEMRV